MGSLDTNPQVGGPLQRGLRTPAMVRSSLLLYAVTDRAWLAGRTLPDCVAQAIAGGATFVQLREKDASGADMRELARAILPLCRRAGVPFVIDDDVEAALAVKADGVHIGQGDAPCAQVRAQLGPDKIIGVSVQTVEQACAARDAGADYLGVGALFSTATKADADLVSFDELRVICDAVDIPVVAIGGLSAATIGSLAGSGVAGAAVVSALFATGDIEESARTLSGIMRDIVQDVQD